MEDSWLFWTHRCNLNLHEETLQYLAAIIVLGQHVLQSHHLTDSQQEVLQQELLSRLDISQEDLSQCLIEAFHPKHRPIIYAHVIQAFNARLQKKSQSEVWKLYQEFIDRFGHHKTLDFIEIQLALIKTQQDHEQVQTQLLRLYKNSIRMGIDPLILTALFRKFGFTGGKTEVVSLEEREQILIGSDTACDIRFFDPLVDPLHASLYKEGTKWAVRPESVYRSIRCNGRLVTRALFPDGSQIQVGPYLLDRQKNKLLLSDNRRFSSLSVRGLYRQIGNLHLLQNISFTVFTGEVIALIGPSGSGKTTLLNAINGVAPANSGKVLFNDQPFHKILQNDRSMVGIVPQDDLVLPELTVEESLYYSGRLRLPPNTKREKIQEEVDRVLAELDITHIRSQRIGDALRRGISGGQRKRVNLGQELLSQNTRILFLDEPTSGLDPRASQEIVALVRSLADRGRIIFLVTHDLTDQIIQQVDNLLVLVKGGQLAYFGRQQEALPFFKVESTDQIFQRFGPEQPDWVKKYQTHRSYGLREMAIDSFAVADKTVVATPKKESGISVFWRQFLTLTARYFKVKSRDRTGLLVILLQPPFLALVMTIVFRHFAKDGLSSPVPSQSMIFMFALSCLWFGMSASVRELISDQVVFRRERRVGVQVFPYVLSKVSVLGLLTALQALFLSSSMYYLFDLQEYGFRFSSLLGVSCLTVWVGMALGLFVSSVWRSSEAAVGTLPLILIPQIAFSSIMYGIRDMGPFAKFCTWFIFQRYTFDAFLKCGDDIAIRTYKGDFEAQPIKGALWKLGLRQTADADDIGFTLMELSWILWGFIALLLFGTLIRVWLRDRNSG